MKDSYTYAFDFFTCIVFLSTAEPCVSNWNFTKGRA